MNTQKKPLNLSKPMPASTRPSMEAAMAFAEAKATKPAKAAEPEGGKLVRLNANIKEELHRKLKMKAAAEGVTMGDLIERWIASL